jgi:galactosamine-6-phosphate isomerase
MNIIECSDYKELSTLAAKQIESALLHKPKQWIGMASGNSPIGVYANLVETYSRNSELFEHMGVVKLDEWCGIASDAPFSCESFLQEHILKPIRIDADRYIALNGNAADLELETARVRHRLSQIGGIDGCILGLGKNGHLGFNEPGDILNAHAHVAPLSKTSQQHAMVKGANKRPTKGLTLGMADIMASELVILLVTGSGKSECWETLESGQITTQCPASMLHLHQNVFCFIDRCSF